MTEGFTSIEQLASGFGISARTAYRWLRAGKVKRKKEGGHTFFLIPDMGDSDKTADRRNMSSSVIPDVRGVTKKMRGPSNSNVSSASVESLKNEIESRRLALELQRLDELERRSEEKLERERAEVLEAEAEMKREEISMRIGQEALERQKRARAEKIQRVKMAAIPAPLMATIPPRILSLTLSEIEIGLAKLDIDNLSERELLIHAEAIRSKIWSDPVYNREVRQAGVRAIFENLDTYLHQEYETAVKKGYTKSFQYFLGEIYFGMTPIQKQQLENFIEGR